MCNATVLRHATCLYPLPLLPPLSIPSDYGDNDPHWTRAFNKLSQLIEYHPSAILFDSQPVDPTVDTGVLEGPRDVKVPMDTSNIQAITQEAQQVVSSGANREAALPAPVDGA